MSMFPLYAHAHPDSIHDLGVIEDAHVFDHNVSEADGLEKRFGIKKIKFHGKKPYGFLADTREKVWFDALHFCAGAKRYIWKYSFAGPLLRFRLCAAYFSPKLFLITHVKYPLIKLLRHKDI